MRHTYLGPLQGLSWGLLALVAVGCSHSDGTEPTYEGCATDENWRTFDDYIATSRIDSGAANSPKWLTPTDGASALAGSAPTFSWQPTPTSAGSTNGNASCAQFTPASVKGLQPLHEPPVSGTVFDVHFAVAGTDSYRVLTTRQSVGVPASVWQGFSGKQVEVTLYSAQLLQNDVAQGLYRATPLKVSVTP